MTPHGKTALAAASLVAGMTGLGFASVPLYRLFCQATGWDGTTQRAAGAPGAVAGRTMVVRFDANRSPKLPWAFRPEQLRETVTIGEREQALYLATNNGSRPLTGTATFNVTPEEAGKYFTKIECFCFTQQTLQPGETVRMPVIYYVDPKILADPEMGDLQEITLSYTFYPVADAAKGG